MQTAPLFSIFIRLFYKNARMAFSPVTRALLHFHFAKTEIPEGRLYHQRTVRPSRRHRGSKSLETTFKPSAPEGFCVVVTRSSSALSGADWSSRCEWYRSVRHLFHKLLIPVIARLDRFVQRRKSRPQRQQRTGLGCWKRPKRSVPLFFALFSAGSRRLRRVSSRVRPAP